jgi:His/Glu/Gln/Arg/opine family amino acid ABC transporter permease subunit
VTGAVSLYWFAEIALATRVTLGVAVCSFLLGLILGLLGAGALLGRSKTLRLFAWSIGTTIRGVPELLTVMTVYYGGQIAMNNLASLLRSPTFDVDPFFAGVLALGIVFGAYAMDVFAGALIAVGKGQRDAAKSLGLTSFQSLRLITFPQSLRIALPGLSNLWLVLIKETALVSAISLNEIMRASDMAVSVTKQPFMYFAFACVLYLILTKISMTLHDELNKRLNRGETYHV